MVSGSCWILDTFSSFLFSFDGPASVFSDLCTPIFQDDLAGESESCSSFPSPFFLKKKQHSYIALSPLVRLRYISSCTSTPYVDNKSESSWPAIRLISPIASRSLLLKIFSGSSTDYDCVLIFALHFSRPRHCHRSYTPHSVIISTYK